MKPRLTKRSGRGGRSQRGDATRNTDPPGNFPVAGVGASAGGLEAIEKFLKALPADTGTAYVLVQHLDPTHESRLTEILSHSTAMPVVEAKQGTEVRPNSVYVIPPNKNISITRQKLHLEPRRNSKTQHMPVDFFFGSLAGDRKHQSIGIILSGTASDGVMGMRAIKAEGGITFAQDPGSAKYAGMPESSIASGAVDFVLPPEEIARHLGRMGNHPYLTTSEPGGKEPEQALPGDRTADQLFGMLKKSFGVDFTNYKSTTVHRRIRRRMALGGIGNREEYLDYLRGNPEELRALFQDMFIGVTEFFRDPGLFKTLERSIFPSIVKNRADDAPIRIWVPGCSTGEEVYSIAISLLEYLGNRASSTSTQIFGTDANEEAIRAARRGRYGKEISESVGPDRLRRYFTKDSEGYQISKAVRDRCVFARHDITRDAPFRNLDLLSCRNLLIYLNTPAHQRLIPLFHFTLKPTGFLVLGSAETVGGFGDLFNLADRHYKIYSKHLTASRPYFEFPHEYASEPAAQPQALPVPPRSGFDLHRAAADQILLSQHGPPAVLVNKNMDILHFRGHTSPYLEPAQGAASLNLLRMAREGLLVGIEKAITSARKKNVPARQEGLRVHSPGGERIVDIDVLPIHAPGTGESTFLIVFENEGTRKKTAGQSRGGRTKTAARRIADDRVVQLQQELAGTKAYLLSVIENQDSANEALRSLNEELQSSNEELHSTTEELETANEELESANEELNTLNEEVHRRSAELAEINERLQRELTARQQAEERFHRMVESAPDAMVFTDAEGKIVLLNGQTEELFGYRRQELIGQPIEILLSERWRKEYVSRLASYMQNPPSPRAETELDLWCRRKDGSEFPAAINLSPLPAEEGSPLTSSIIRDISRQKAMVERANQALRLEERNHMAMDVHDTLAQGLTGIVLQLEAAEEVCKQEPPEAMRHIVRARELARSTLEEARRSVLVLSGSPPGEKGLGDSILEMVERFRSETPVRLEFSLTGIPQRLDVTAEENVLRIAQQAVTNALQHSQANCIQVELAFNTVEAQLCVTDNGRGFVASAARDGFGLRSMRERARYLGATFHLSSQPGEGTRIEVQIPISPSAARPI